MVSSVFTRTLLVAVAAAVVGVSAQDLRPQTSPYQHVTAAAGASAPAVAAGATVTLWADVTPRANIHVYAPGAKDFEPPKIVVAANKMVTAGKPVFPAGVLTTLAGVSTRVPVYSKTFRVTQPITVAANAPKGGAVIVAATLSYQACDDKVCYPPATLPLFWRIGVN
jgi:hypothetical protein